MFIVVVGGGKLGTYLSRALLEEQHEVVVIEKDERKAARLAQTCRREGLVQIGDGCDPLVLEEAGAERADIVIADTGDDEDNLVICLVTKKRFSRPRTIARVNNPKNQQIFQELGIDSVINSTEIVMKMVQQEVNVREVAPLLSFKGSNLALVRLSVPASSPANERRLSDIALPRHSVVVALERGGDVIVPDGDTTVQAGDAMLIVTQPSATRELRAQLIGVN